MNIGPYLGVTDIRDVAFEAVDARFQVFIANGYAAYGIVNAEEHGIVVFNAKQQGAVIDRHRPTSGGLCEEVERIADLSLAEFADFILTHPRFRGAETTPEVYEHSLKGTGIVRPLTSFANKRIARGRGVREQFFASATSALERLAASIAREGQFKIEREDGKKGESGFVRLQTKDFVIEVADRNDPERMVGFGRPDSAALQFCSGAKLENTRLFVALLDELATSAQSTPRPRHTQMRQP